MTSIWVRYVAWYELLVQWASALVDEGAARRYARRTLAEMFLLALNAYDTLDGPYMHSSDLLYRHVCMDASASEPGFVSWAWTQLAYPDESFVSDVAELYSAVYELGYMSNLTLSERTEIAALISLYDPSHLLHDQLEARLTQNCPTTHPLRRAVKALRTSPPPAQHIQARAQELENGERQRGMAWLKRQTIENGAL